MQLSSRLTFVYWIHLPEHTDKFTQGYIGVSQFIDRRWKEHKNDALKNKHPNRYLQNAINKYQDTLIYDIIFVGEEPLAYAQEALLRPQPSIGWNLMSGGTIGKITAEGRKRLSEANLGKRKSEADKITTRWQKYLETHSHITRKKFIDLEAINKQQVPPSKSNLPIFSILQNEEYPNIESAITDNWSAFDIYLECETKTGDWIYLSDL